MPVIFVCTSYSKIDNVMKRNPLLLALVLLSPLTLTNADCSRDCQFALCDLVTKIAVDATISATVGVPFNIPNQITNLAATLEFCKGDLMETLSARESRSRIKIDYDLNSSGSYSETVKNAQFDVPGIQADEMAEELYTFAFNEPGYYRIITFCDDNDDNEERDENNNASAVVAGEANRANGKAAAPLIIYVAPNPNYQRKEGDPFVEIISRTVSIRKI
jgi:hypothetical protein